MKILEELWYGNINPQGPDAQKNPRMEQALYLVVKNEDAMRAMLSDTQKEQFEGEDHGGHYVHHGNSIGGRLIGKQNRFISLSKKSAKGQTFSHKNGRIEGVIRDAGPREKRTRSRRNRKYRDAGTTGTYTAKDTVRKSRQNWKESLY